MSNPILIRITLDRKTQTCAIERGTRVRTYRYQAFTRRWRAFQQFVWRFAYEPLIIAGERGAVHVDCGSVYTCAKPDGELVEPQAHAARICWIVLRGDQVTALADALRDRDLDPETPLLLDGILPDAPDTYLAPESRAALKVLLFRCAICDTWRATSQRSAAHNICTVCQRRLAAEDSA